MRFGFHSAVSVAVHLTSFFFLFKNFSLGEDPYVYFDWRTSYITASPLGVLQQRNCRSGIQQRKNSWQDGVSGTNCPIPAGWNWTSEFQVKDQIGSFFYFPSLNFQSASGRYGGITINNRPIITLPFGTPDGDITLLISDWYTRSHKYNEALLPQNDEYLAVNVEPGPSNREFGCMIPWRRNLYECCESRDRQK